MAKYQCKLNNLVTIGVVVEEYPNVQTYLEECQEMETNGYNYLCEAKQPATLEKYCFYIKYSTLQRG